MSPPNERSARGANPGAAQISAATKQQDHGDRTAAAPMPVAFATRFLAAGSASFDWAVVRRCPICGFSHRHVIFEGAASTIERAPACAKHRTYTVTITSTVPSAAERGRAAA